MRSSRRSIHIHIAGILVIAALLAGNGCSLLMLGNLGSADPAAAEPEAIDFTGAELTLAWDPPASEVASYRLFYRLHGASAWILLNEVGAAPAPECTVDHAEVGDGEFDFGVVAVAEDEAQSQMHTSLDDTAQPECGWYLRWVD